MQGQRGAQDSTAGSGGTDAEPLERGDEPLVVAEPDAFALLAHLVTSAELCLTEPWDYGTFRLVDAASRLAASMLPCSSGQDREFLASFLADLEAGKGGSTLDREQYLEFLRGLSRRIAERLAGRPVSAEVSRGAPAAALAAAQAPAPGIGIPTAAETLGQPPPAPAEVVLETIRSRRVTREFDSRQVAYEALRLVLEAGRWATSGGGRRVHPLLIVRDPVTIARLRAVTPGMFSSPPVVVVVCTDAGQAAAALIQLEHDATTMIDVGTLTMNMLVAAQALGLGACPVTSFSHAAARVVLDLPAAIEPELFVLLGHPAAPIRRARPARAAGRAAAALPAGFAWWERVGRAEPEGGQDAEFAAAIPLDGEIPPV
ncbi:MAG: nitroreductase [Chloroflexi bacterium]|nr:nitroreductase [Chloroflexota bacterium]